MCNRALGISQDGIRMAQKLLKRKPRKVAPTETGNGERGTGNGRAVTPRPPCASAVLVGTYKAKQLAWIKRHGIYNYPVKDGDEFDEKSFASIKELWLYADVKGTRHVFEAEFFGIKTREELISEYGYPDGNVLAAKNGRARPPGAPHGSRYYVFKTKYLDYGPRLDDPFVIARTADFGGRSAKVKKAIEQFKADGEFAPLEHYLPSDLSKVPRNRLRVCEAAVQLELCHMVSAYSDPFCRYIIGNDITPLFLCGDALAILRELPSESVDCCMTSPPYWNKRQYAGGGIGLESDFHAFIDNLLDIFAEVKRILKPSGSFWLNIGDSYLDKNLLNVPSRVAIRMQDEQGWILRNTVIWNKVKGCPDNSEDKLRNIYEPIYHFVKRAIGYYYDVDSVRRKPHQAKVVKGAIVSATGVSGVRYKRQIEFSTELTAEQKSNALAALGEMLLKVQNGDVSDFRMIIKGSQRTTHSDSECVSGRARELHEKGFYFLKYNPKGAKPSDLWDIIPEDTQGRVMHFAPYPEDLCKTPILLTCPLNGIVLDPFSGTGTTSVVAMALGRKSVGIDISSAYIEEAKKRIRKRFIQPELNLQEEFHE